MECDLHEHYGIDTYDHDALAARPWYWLRSRIVGLLAVDCRTTRALHHDHDDRR